MQPGQQRLAGRVAYVLGGGSDGPARPGEALPMGNGRAIALRLAAEGATVVVGDKVLARAEATVAHLAVPGLAVEVDAADPASCRAAVESAVDHGGRLDIVVCNGTTLCFRVSLLASVFVLRPGQSSESRLLRSARLEFR